MVFTIPHLLNEEKKEWRTEILSLFYGFRMDYFKSIHETRENDLSAIATKKWFHCYSLLVVAETMKRSYKR